MIWNHSIANLCANLPISSHLCFFHSMLYSQGRQLHAELQGALELMCPAIAWQDCDALSH